MLFDFIIIYNEAKIYKKSIFEEAKVKFLKVDFSAFKSGFKPKDVIYR